MERYLRCKVYPGQFSDEYAVSGKQTAGGRGFSLFAPVDRVRTEVTPTRDHTVDGWLRVTIYEEDGAKAVVRLPRESFECGGYVTVPIDQLQAPTHPSFA